MASAMAVMQRLAWDWGIRCFGQEHMNSYSIRSLRMAEEAIEAAQACFVDPAVFHKLIDAVYARPIGSVDQELGGVVVTASVLCTATGPVGQTLEDLFERELRRCLSKSPEHFAKRNREKLDLGLTA